MVEERDARRITPAEKEMFLNLKAEDITLKWLQQTFGNHYNRASKKNQVSQFETYDEIVLSKGEYTNTEDVVTTCGLMVFNKFAIEPVGFDKLIGYWNKTLGKKGWGEIEDIMSGFIMDDMTGELVPKYYDFLDRVVWLAFSFHTEIAASKTLKSIKPISRVQAEKKRLLKENRKAIDEKDLIKIVEIQNQLVNVAKEEMEDDPCYQLYDSGARGAFDNAYRQAMIMKGPVWNSAKDEWEIVENSLYEGIERKDLPAMANAVISGVYPKSIGTGECGYLTKRLSGVFQGVVLGPKGSDCKTPLTVEVELVKSNIKLYYYNYILDGKNLVRLDNTTRDKYIGKTVKMRLPSCCLAKDACNICAGDRMYLLGLTDIGLTTGRVSNSLLRARMKQAHDATVRTHTTTLDKMIV